MIPVHSSATTRSYRPEVLDAIKQLVLSSRLTCHSSKLLSNVGKSVVAKVVHLVRSVHSVNCEARASSEEQTLPRFDPMLSLEVCLGSGNIKPECFKYASKFSPKGGKNEELVLAMKEYGLLGHKIGSNVYYTWCDFKGLLERCGAPEDCSKRMVRFAQRWASNAVVRCDPSELQCGIVDVSEDYIDETMVTSCLGWLACAHSVLMPEEQADVQECICKALIEFLKACVSHWCEHGGHVLCSLKVINILTAIKSAMITAADLRCEVQCSDSEPVASGAREQTARAVLPTSVYPVDCDMYSVCFVSRFSCNGCVRDSQNLSKVQSCRKRILHCCSSTNIMAVTYIKIFYGDDNPFDELEDTRQVAMYTVDFAKFPNVDRGVVERVMSCVGNILSPSEDSEGAGTSDSVLSVSDASVYSIAQSVSQARSTYRHHFDEKWIFRFRGLLHAWVSCICSGAQAEELSEYRLLEFVKFLTQCCHLPGQKKCVEEAARVAYGRVRCCYASGGEYVAVSKLVDIIEHMMFCLFVLGYREAGVFAVWLRASIVLGNGAPPHKRRKIDISDDTSPSIASSIKFPRYYGPDGGLLLPNEVNKD